VCYDEEERKKVTRGTKFGGFPRKLEGIEKVFEVDAKPRGFYIPPLTYQLFNKDCTVKNTHTL
jgi:hypothetical protein